MSTDGQLATNGLSLGVHELSVTYRRGRRPALDRVEVVLDSRSTVVVGPNGAGKSTLLKVLAGQLRPSAGRVEGLPSRLGYCPQRPVALPAFTVREQVAYAGWLGGLGRGQAEAAAGPALAQADLVELQDQSAVALSGGQAARLGIACALVTGPSMLLLDEPTAALDPIARASVREVLVALDAAGVTVVASSHTAADVAAPFGRLILLDQGQVRYDGGTEQFFTDAHAHPVVAEFARALHVR